MLSNQSANRTLSFAAFIADTDAIKTSGATDTAPQHFSLTDLDGVIGQAVMKPPRTVSVTAAANTGTYIAHDIVVTGLDENGNVVSETLSLTTDDGGETIDGSVGFASVTDIDIPEQLDADGALEFGVRDVVCAGTPPTWIHVGTGGNLHLGYADGTEDTVTNVPSGDTLAISPAKIFGDGGTTATNVSIGFAR